jgi:hypothetical protein
MLAKNRRWPIAYNLAFFIKKAKSVLESKMLSWHSLQKKDYPHIRLIAQLFLEKTKYKQRKETNKTKV